MIYIFKTISFVFMITFFVVFIRRIMEFNRRRKNMVRFLILNKDEETLNCIGYKEFFGEEFGLRKSFSLGNAVERLDLMYDKTGRKEYLEYSEYLSSNGYKSVFIFLGFFICLVVTFA